MEESNLTNQRGCGLVVYKVRVYNVGMKKIKLSNANKYVLLDNDDYERLKKYKYWLRRDGYACHTLHRRSDHKTDIATIVCMQWEIVERKSGKQVDHINGNKLDNRKENLRVCSNSENQINRPAPKNSSTGYKGVCYHKRDKRFRAQITFGGITYRLGTFKTAIEGAIAYNKKAKELTPFAYLNKI